MVKKMYDRHNTYIEDGPGYGQIRSQKTYTCGRVKIEENDVEKNGEGPGTSYIEA